MPQGSNSATTSSELSGLPTENDANRRQTAPARKLRSCMVCRSRKVRCDKQSPCSNCHRANIACVLAPNDRPPRWMRRLDQHQASRADAPDVPASAMNSVMERVRNLEKMVKELSNELQLAQTTSSSEVPAFDAGKQNHDDNDNIISTSTESAQIPYQFGRLVIEEFSGNRYVGSNFWSRVNDEVRFEHTTRDWYSL